LHCESNSSSQQCEWPCGTIPQETSNTLTVVPLLYCESHSSSQQCEWPCCLRCHGTSSKLAVVVLLCCCESHGSSRREWRCCVRCNDTSSYLTVLLLLYLRVIAVAVAVASPSVPCGWSPSHDASINLTVMSLLYCETNSSSKPAPVAVLFES